MISLHTTLKTLAHALYFPIIYCSLLGCSNQKPSQAEADRAVIQIFNLASSSWPEAIAKISIKLDRILVVIPRNAPNELSRLRDVFQKEILSSGDPRITSYRERIEVGALEVITLAGECKRCPISKHSGDRALYSIELPVYGKEVSRTYFGDLAKELAAAFPEQTQSRGGN